MDFVCTAAISALSCQFAASSTPAALGSIRAQFDMQLATCDTCLQESSTPVISPNVEIELNNTVIRHAEAGDYKAIVARVDEWWGGRRMAPMLPKLFFVHFCQTSFVAERDGVLIGFVVGLVSQSYPDEGYIHFVGIHPNFRKGGLGQQLYERVFEAMIGSGCKVVRCVTSPVNKGSIAFHLRLGFKPEVSEKVVEGISVFEDYDGPQEDRVLFSKILRAPGVEPGASTARRSQ